MPRAPSPEALAQLKTAVGTGGWLAEPADVAPYLVDHRRLYQGATPLVLMPNSTAQVADIVRLCARDAIALVPQ
jgi:FAD/FMN-containing dehydrogenase